MRIKSLHISGFKSFADAALLQFGDGITGVVGPNGCGKSNIIDAIRWVMGEMSAKHLRGRGMQDVIFAGSESRGPSGLAEVTITFHNDGNVPPQYASYSEIAVTRRLHRDNTSEYLINKVPCRLRDITDLFLGTGVGTRAYSIIEQGRIGFIVSARPEDRRTLIEEVAGITKFKARRKAAERRMEATEQNLARVNDIVSELERQLASLRRQAKKAERYKRIKEELRDLDLHVATVNLLEMSVREKVMRAQREELEERHQRTTAEVATREAELETERLEHLEEEQRLQREQTATAEVETRLAALERDLEHWRRQLEETERRQTEAAHEVEASRRRVEEVSVERAALDQQIAELESTGAQDHQRLDEARQGVELIQRELTEIDARSEALRRDLLELVHEIARQRSEGAALEKRSAEVSERRRRLLAEREEIAAKAAEMEGREAEWQARRQQTAGELESWRERRASLATDLSELHAECDRSEEHILSLRSDRAQAASRLESLEQIARRLEGYSDGVRSLLRPEEGDGPAVGGIRGLVTEALRVPPEYERAVEAVLGNRLELLIVESEAAGKDAIAYLREHGGGRSGFITSAARAPRGEGFGGRASGPGVVGRARDLVRPTEGNEALADALLGEALIVEDLDTALALWREGEIPAPIATRAGELVEPTGAFSGGSDEGAGLLSKAREIRELRARVEELDASLAQATEAHQALEARRVQLDVDIQQLDKEIRKAELELVELDKDLQAIAAERTRLAERAEVLEIEGQGLADELSDIGVAAAAASEAAALAESRKVDLDAQAAQCQQRRAELAELLEQRSSALTALKVEVAARDEKLIGARAAVARLEGAATDHGQRIERGVRSIDEGAELCAQLRERIAEGEELARTTSVTLQERRSSLSEARAVYEANRGRFVEIEQLLREQRRENDLVRESLTELKMDLQRLQLERDQMLERIAERHDVDLLKVAGDYHLRPLPAAEDLERRNELERSLKNMGSINLTAIEECAEVEKRYGFLTAQRDDLTDALDSLRRAIQRINRASRERFREAFEAVNNMFQQVFPRLFRGGEARLELLAHDDVLEAGVDIIAQPPGKKLQSVGLLSGGEKALTAVALIFSIFMIKPSPFCVLDEVDAPLDDQNVTRFNEILREIAKISQFIVITHNKLTMTEADRLYGITMEEPGMSKLVQVDLDGDGDGADAPKAA